MSSERRLKKERKSGKRSTPAIVKNFQYAIVLQQLLQPAFSSICSVLAAQIKQDDFFVGGGDL